jgi:NAD(P)-dependent dehydrogenase (short-subunit alcohol dehydrogenase family)
LKPRPFINVAVTGATSGIGRAVVERLATLGAKKVFFCGRDSVRIAETAKALETKGTEAHGAVLDVSDAAATRRWLETCDAVAPLDLVFANAGLSTGGREDDENAVRRVFDVDVLGVINTVLPALDLFRSDADGRSAKLRAAKRIAITSSMTAYHGMPQCPAYSAAKACVKAWGAGLRGRVAKNGISVSVVCPGFVRSRITDENTCPMPFFWEAPKAAKVICDGIAKERGLIAFPWQMRFVSWLLGSLPETLSERIFALLPEKN